MKTLTQEQVKEILRKHKIWLEDLTNEEAERADLQEANLQEANLQEADLQQANLQGANLRWAKLQKANLQGANLRWANLRGANLQKANLQGANLQEADYASMQCPEEGAFIAFKKCRDGKIVKLLIPEDAKRSSATSRKCRASKAIVLGITSLDGKIQYKEAVSDRDRDFIYRKGETVEAKDFDNDRWEECAPGIHFFITRQEAIDY